MTIDDKTRDEKLQHDINRETAKISTLSYKKIDNYKFLTGDKILSPDQRRVIDQATFAYSALGKAFEKQTKTIEEQGKKQIDAITDQNKRPEALNNKDDHRGIYKPIFDRVVKERFVEIKKLTYQIDHVDLIYYFKNNTTKVFNDFHDGIEIFKKNTIWWIEDRRCKRTAKYI